MKTKNLITCISLAVILIAGIVAVCYGYSNYLATNAEVTQKGDSYVYSEIEPDGVADLIVEDNIEKAMAANNVAAIVFDFRGYDTLGESFILLTAIAGSFVILARNKKHKEGEA